MSQPKKIAQRADSPAWHARPAAEAVVALTTTASGGLSAAEAAHRLAQHGANTLPSAHRRSTFARFLAQFNNAVIYFLLVTAVGAILLGHLIDAGVIIAVVIVNAVVGFVQEGKAEQALDAIRQMIAPTATVIRDGGRRSIPATELVPGDVVRIEAGDQVPADLRLLETRALVIDEAILTGESVPAEKQTQQTAADAALGDRSCMAWSGTLVAAGQGKALVVGTGSNTEIGHISTLLGAVEVLDTPLLQQINRFGRRFAVGSMIAAALIFLFAVMVRSLPWDEALLLVVALAVGVVPEGLLAVITITLAIGVQRMAARKAIVRRLPAVETLGATAIICSDKTGTLTRNEMTVRRVVTADGELLVEGAGYVPRGALLIDGERAAAPPVAAALIRAGLLCNDAQLVETDSQWRTEGDPMEGALIALAIKAGFDPASHREEHARLDAIPFDARYRYMASLHRDPSTGVQLIALKGAPEQLLALCTQQAGADGRVATDHAFWAERIAAAAAHGERVLGFAMGMTEDHDISHDSLANGLTFLGIAGFIDPPRPEAVAAIAECRSAGIQVKMITGDHALTASAIAVQLGLTDHPNVMTGAQLDEIDDADLPAAAAQGTVFARTSPEHKLRLVRALQSTGAVVAMTGDGVNDAPALKQANVGVAMGRKGTEAAKQAAEVVLVDDNFATIVNAVHEGRTVFDNIRKVIAWTLPTNGGEALTLLVALALGLTLPLTAVQILWNNLVTTGTLGLVLAFEAAEPGVMQRPPRPAGTPLLSRFMVWRIALVSVLFVSGSYVAYSWAMAQGYDVETGRTMVVNAIIVMEIFYLFNVRYLHTRSISWRGILGTPVVLIAVGTLVAAQFAFTYLPIMQTLFDTRPLPLVGGLLIVGIGVALLLFLELEKTIMRRTGLMQRLGD